MNSIQITKNAWKKMFQILQQTNHNRGFLYSASSGGCNGFNFELNLLEKKLHNEITQKKFYTMLQNDSTKVYVDPVSEMYLLGTTIDYVSEDYSKGEFESKFKFIINEIMFTNDCIYCLCDCFSSFTLYDKDCHKKI